MEAFRNLSSSVYDRILGLIADGELHQGDLISHRDLAENLSCSKQPVGSALRRLEIEGVVESIPRVGTRVRRVSPEDMWGVLQWRLALECRAVALACEWITMEEAEELLECARKFDSLFYKLAEADLPRTAPERRNLLAEDMNFHLQLAKFAHCPRLGEELNKLNIYHLKTVLCDALNAVRPRKLAMKVNHEDLAMAIAEKKKRRAVDLMEKHLERSGDMLDFTKWYRKYRREESVSR